MKSRPRPHRTIDGKTWRRWSLLLAFVGLASLGILALKQHVFEGFQVPSRSMLPTLAPGDLVWVNKLAYQSSTPSRGDLVVFHHPRTGVLFVKRVLGLPGERVTVLGRQVLVGEHWVETFDRKATVTAPDGQGTYQGVVLSLPGEPAVSHRVAFGADPDVPWRLSGSWRVPASAVFVMGDARDESEDSRQFGSVPLSALVGQVRCVSARSQGRYWSCAPDAPPGP